MRFKPQFYYQVQDPPGDPPKQDPPKQDPPKADPPKQDPPKQDPPGPVPYERFKEVNDQYQTLKSRLEALEKKEKETNEEALKKQGEWQKLAEQREAELKAERVERLRLDVALRKGLPVELAARLQGETAEALEKDADVLLPLLILKPKSPGVPPGGPGGKPAGALDLASMTPAQIREKSADILKQARES